jgi:hypothetical protein
MLFIVQSANIREIHYAPLGFSRASTTVRSPVKPSQRTRRRVSSPGRIPMTVPVRWLSHTFGSRRRTRAPRAKWMGVSGIGHAASIEALAVVTQFEIRCATDSLSAIASSLLFGVPICENFNSTRTPCGAALELSGFRWEWSTRSPESGMAMFSCNTFPWRRAARHR